MTLMEEGKQGDTKAQNRLMRTAGVMSSVWVPEVIRAELKTVIGRSHDYTHRG